MTIARGDAVEFEYTGRRTDGTVFDTSRADVAEETGLAEAQPDREYGPVGVEIGAGNIIEGLEEALIGLEVGDQTTVTIPPEKGYGEWDDEQVREFETDELRDVLEGDLPEVGAYLETQAGTRGEVTEVGEHVISVDFNSPLAGEPLEFDIEIVAVEAAKA